MTTLGPSILKSIIIIFRRKRINKLTVVYSRAKVLIHFQKKTLFKSHIKNFDNKKYAHFFYLNATKKNHQDTSLKFRDIKFYVN